MVLRIHVFGDDTEGIIAAKANTQAIQETIDIFAKDKLRPLFMIAVDQALEDRFRTVDGNDADEITEFTGAEIIDGIFDGFTNGWNVFMRKRERLENIIESSILKNIWNQQGRSSDSIDGDLLSHEARDLFRKAVEHPHGTFQYCSEDWERALLCAFEDGYDAARQKFKIR